MNHNSVFSQFTSLYPLSKTLRFELIPQGATLENIHKNNILENDIHRADAYVKVKKIIDEYHKFFIDKALDGCRLVGLDEYFQLYTNADRSDQEKKEFELLQTHLRKQVAERFSKHPDESIKEAYNKLFTKELIKVYLKDFVDNTDDLSLVNEFDDFTTYFTGFHENRKNMYSADEKSTAISYRLIHQNLPKFIDNAQIFKNIKTSSISNHFEKMISELGSIIQVEKIEEMFEMEYFNETLNQLGIDKYNILLGGYTSEDGKVIIEGLNQYINRYDQPKIKSERIGKLKPLYKQILSDRNSASFLPEEFNSDTELLESIESFYQDVFDDILNQKEVKSLYNLVSNINEYDLDKIFVSNDLGLTDISKKKFGHWNAIEQAIAKHFEKIYTGKSQVGTDKFNEAFKKYMKGFDSFSLSFLNSCVHKAELSNEPKSVSSYLALLGEIEKTNVFDKVNQLYTNIEPLLKSYSSNKNLAQDKEAVVRIKEFLDSIKTVQNFVKPLLGKGNEADKDARFYGEFVELWNRLDQITPLYNKVRNYLTRKPYSTEKVKVNFDNSTLLDGWDANKEEANTSILFEKNGIFYLGIMDKKHNKIFRKVPKSKTDDTFKKVNYKLLPGASKMLPKVFFGKSNVEYYSPSDEIFRIRNHGSHTKNGSPQSGYDKHDFNLNDCHKIIDFFKTSIDKHPEWSNFGFNFSETKSYNSIDEFYREVEAQGYSINYTKIDSSVINQWVEEGKLYLFKIYNKDFSPYSKGTPNMHTMYWKLLFDKKNLDDVVYKLNGQAEVFWRKASIKQEDLIVHKAKESIANKNSLNKKESSVFEYDIIKDKRFSVDKFQFHVPITLNFKAKALININPIVNECIQNNQIKHIIGIDRGERHLLYLSVIDLDGNIVKQFSLNEIVNEFNGNTYKTNYHTLLNTKEGNRDEARKNWKTIETIKELKEGYLSQVIHKISELIVSYQAIVVLEDLNFGFMRGRQKVEKQVYQKFEKMLIDKLNYLVFKKKDVSDEGGALKALQLTNKFESFQKLGKQSGFLFYTAAWNTSKIDPTTGFVNFFNLKYESIEKAQEFFKRFDKIQYNEKESYFEFHFDYNNFTKRAEGTQTKWTACSYGERILNFRNEAKNGNWDHNTIDLSKDLIKLFEEAGINYKDKELQKQIIIQNDKKFFESLIHTFKLMLQMRNSISNSEVDYLISPVKNKDGYFYDSRKSKDNLPKDADANGAFNIARKGLLIIDKLKETKDLARPKLNISNKEWLFFAQNM